MQSFKLLADIRTGVYSALMNQILSVFPFFFFSFCKLTGADISFVFDPKPTFWTNLDFQKIIKGIKFYLERSGDFFPPL